MLPFVNIMYTLIDLQIFNHPFIPEINPDLLWCLFFLNIA